MKRTGFLLIFLAACGGSTKAPAGPTEDRPVAATAAETVTLVELSQGDAACYVVVKDAAGNEQTHPGTFDLCPGGAADASNAIGFPVQLTFGKQNVMAASCEGDPDCPDTEEVEAVMSITPVRTGRNL